MGAHDDPPGPVRPTARAGAGLAGATWPGTRCSLLRSLSNRRWSERTIIGLVMQSLDNSLTTYRKPKRRRARACSPPARATARPTPTRSPRPPEAATLLAEEINGFAGLQHRRADGHPAHRALPRRLPDRRRRATTGVIDPYHRLYGHPGISVVDGAAVSANLGVNPSLTITAQAERAMSLLAQQGRGGPAPGAGRGVRSGWRRSSRSPPRGPGGGVRRAEACRSWRSRRYRRRSPLT